MLLAKLVLIRSMPQDKEGYTETQNHITPLICLSLTKIKHLLEIFDNSFATVKIRVGTSFQNEHAVSFHDEENIWPKLWKEFLKKKAP